jgi:hypothetical protein
MATTSKPAACSSAATKQQARRKVTSKVATASTKRASSAASAAAGENPRTKSATKPTSVASKIPRADAAKRAAAKKKFEQGILARGEAVPRGEPLPPGATHEIVGKARDGTPILRRKRFSLT